jgi:hypothetical protein
MENHHYLFITFTCNPKWKEITEQLLPGQQAFNRPDLLVRVFKLKLKELKNDLTKKEVFGKITAYIYVIEFQKRGLPHAHILIILDENSKLKTTQEYDKIVCAEIPSKEDNLNLFELVVQHMIHRPCGRNSKNQCMVANVCSKRFPKAFSNETVDAQDGYPIYKRRSPTNGGHVFEKTRSDGTVIQVINNSWVVPYNPYLLLKYQAHINVEICSSIVSIKYLYKYVYKGHDRVMYRLRPQQQNNEEDNNNNNNNNNNTITITTTTITIIIVIITIM